MRFLMINLIFVCLLLFGIGYLAFGDTGKNLNLDSHDFKMDRDYATSYHGSQAGNLIIS